MEACDLLAKRAFWVVGAVLLASVAHNCNADAHVEWFSERGYDMGNCDVAYQDPEVRGDYFRLFMVNPFSVDLRLAYWLEPKETIKIHGRQQPFAKKEWRIRDMSKFYVLDVVERKCVNTLLFTYADEGSTIEFSRGMNPKRKAQVTDEIKRRDIARRERGEWKPGDCLEGNCRDGEGVRLLSRDNKIAGNFRNAEVNGYGVLVFASGGLCEGYWRDGSMNGIGICHYRDGGYHVGYYANGRRGGEGVSVDSNGFVTDIGIWKNGRFDVYANVDIDDLDLQLTQARDSAPEWIRRKLVSKELRNTLPSTVFKSNEES